MALRGQLAHSSALRGARGLHLVLEGRVRVRHQLGAALHPARGRVHSHGLAPCFPAEEAEVTVSKRMKFVADILSSISPGCCRRKRLAGPFIRVVLRDAVVYEVMPSLGLPTCLTPTIRTFVIRSSLLVTSLRHVFLPDWRSR